MPSAWKDIPLNSKLFQNVPETILTNSNAALENCFQAENGAHVRFPGLKDFSDLDGNAPTYLHEWKGDLVAVSNGNTYRVGRDGTSTNVTGVPVSGGQRPTFSRTDDELMTAAGGPITRLAGTTTEILSKDAPDSTHVGYVDGYVIAIEPGSGRFYHAQAGTPRIWDPLDVFAAESRPDDANALAVTPRRELLIGGIDSIEQYERLPSGTTPFFRRWAVGEGIFAPYTLVTADNGAWVINKDKEFVRFAGQVSDVASDAINLSMEDIDDWTEAWASLFHTQGQKFIVLQMPNATNSYGTKGVTCLHDYRQRRWFNLFGWDDDIGTPTRWPGWSYYRMWGREFVGGNGKILELDPNTYTNDGQTQRMLGRTGHIDKWGEVRVDNLRMRVRRGVVGSNDTDPVISIRAIRDNGKPTRWKSKGLGKAGDRTMNIEFGGFGCAHAWQFEYYVTDGCKVELVSMQAQLTRMG